MIARERRRDRRGCDVGVSRSGKAVRRMEFENSTERDGLIDDETRDPRGYIQGRRATGHKETIQVNYNADTETQARQCEQVQ